MSNKHSHWLQDCEFHCAGWFLHWVLFRELRTTRLFVFSACCSGMLQMPDGADARAQEPMWICMFSSSCFMHVGLKKQDFSWTFANNYLWNTFALSSTARHSFMRVVHEGPCRGYLLLAWPVAELGSQRLQSVIAKSWYSGSWCSALSKKIWFRSCSRQPKLASSLQACSKCTAIWRCKGWRGAWPFHLTK